MSDKTPEELAEIAQKRRDSLAQARAARAAKKTAAASGGATAAPRVGDLPDTIADPNSSTAASFLSAEEIAQIRAEARAKVIAEKKAMERKRLIDAEIRAARQEEGLLPPGPAEDPDELVDIYIDLPRFPNQTDPPFLLIDQKYYFHGTQHQVTRAQRASMLDMMSRARRHMAAFKGESMAYYDQQRGQMIYQGGAAMGGVHA